MDHLEYTCIGRANVKKATVLALSLGASSTIVGVLSTAESALAPYLNLAFLLLLLLSILVFVRFIGTRYSYKLLLYPFLEGDLVIIELRGSFGKNSKINLTKTVCRVGIDSITELVWIESKNDRKKYREIKRSTLREGARWYNYTADLFAQKLLIIKIEDGDGISYVKFSPDERLAALLNK